MKTCILSVLSLITIFWISCRQSGVESVSFEWNCRDLSKNRENQARFKDFNIKLVHREGDPEKTHRLYISNGMLHVELLPSKGLSVGQADLNGRQLFWPPPFDMPNTDSLDFYSSSVAVNGTYSPGLEFLKTFMGGIESYGLENWGMSYTDNWSGKFYPLHGEISNLPLHQISWEMTRQTLRVSGTYIVRDFMGNDNVVWYQQGQPVYEVTRTILLQKDQPRIRLSDQIKNVSFQSQTPDIGYHVTFYPEQGAKLMIPSQSIENRGGGMIPEGYETWPPSDDPSVRFEVGVIRKGLQIQPDILNGHAGVRSLIVYPDGIGYSVTTPPMPYYQSWNCSGGAGSNEFTDETGKSILIRNWDGIGIEFGSSALDNDGNIDPAFTGSFQLQPDSILQMDVIVQVHSSEETERLAREIKNYNHNQMHIE